MRVDGKNVKSLVFSLLRNKLENKEKTSTFRTNFIPKYLVGEVIALAWRNADKSKDLLSLVTVIAVYPKKVKEATLEEAKMDGFDTVKEFQDCILDLNKIQLENYGFFTQWDYNVKLPAKQTTLDVGMKQ